MRCTIWYYLYDSKNVKNAHRGVLVLVKLPAISTMSHADHPSGNRRGQVFSY